jgi:hypothetical protein
VSQSFEKLVTPSLSATTTVVSAWCCTLYPS